MSGPDLQVIRVRPKWGDDSPGMKGELKWAPKPITQSEVSQKDKDHYNILTHIYGI